MPPAPPGDRPMRIAVDAMGGDGGVPVNIEGAIAAAREYGLDVILVGEQTTIERELARHRVGKLPITVRHASQVVEMGEQPSHALRRKRDSSMRVAASLVRDGEASAFISAGNTGAAMAIAMFTMGVLPGVDRPAIAVVLPNKRGRTILLDVGANIDPKPWHLAQYAVMGHIYARDILGAVEPRVGLLSVGEEEGKGNELVREVFKRLEESPINFVGNVEGRDVFNGSCDVIVCDGFVGNVVLKSAESVAELIGGMLKEELSRTARTKAGYLLAKPAFDALRQRTEYSEFGAAPLLGINGGCFIGHGRSNPRAIQSAIRRAVEFSTAQVDRKIRDKIAELHDKEQAQEHAVFGGHQPQQEGSAG